MPSVNGAVGIVSIFDHHAKRWSSHESVGPITKAEHNRRLHKIWEDKMAKTTMVKGHPYVTSGNAIIKCDNTDSNSATVTLVGFRGSASDIIGYEFRIGAYFMYYGFLYAGEGHNQGFPMHIKEEIKP